ncbi:MAG TPA: hypothetical protein VFC87_07460 [Perlabentimonas sp.]|nr:hypothetical protein [Perlabentimonas sp.]
MRASNKYRIFGKVVEVCTDQSLSKHQVDELFEPISLYPEVSKSETSDIVVYFIVTPIKQPILARNPSVHSETKNGFIQHQQKYSVGIELVDEKLIFSIYLQPQAGKLKSYLSKLYSMDFALITSRLSQVFFEQVMVPSAYFNQNQFLVHSSCMLNPQSQAILLGGTGGVGKTSLELELCQNRGYKFMADDISVVDSDAFVYPNLAFPKIYGYNMVGNPNLYKKVMKGRSLQDRLAFKLKKTLFGSASVRRKVSPLKLYGGIKPSKAKIGKYIILVKENRTHIALEPISYSIAVKATLSIMQTEYSTFHNHILWHEYYRNAKGVEPIVSVDSVVAKWRELANSVFKSVNCYMLYIPLNIEHKKFINEACDLISQTD